MKEEFYYVAPRESMDSILREGIFPPREVMERIQRGQLPSSVLGVSFGMDSSNFPEYVSLLEQESTLHWVAEQICFSRMGRYNDPNFVAKGYSINPSLRDNPEFVNNGWVKQMNPDAYPSEVLYRGRIPPEMIKRVFEVRV